MKPHTLVQQNNDQGKPRQAGVEIEFSNATPELILSSITSQFSGNVCELTPMEFLVEDTEFGTFKVELDADLIKKIASEHLSELTDESSFSARAAKVLTDLAQELVPWEIVTPPIPFDKIHLLNKMIDILRQGGAKGTRSAMHYAFGVHLNPELPNFEPETIVSYLRAFFCLYDWIVEQENIDLTRRLTPYIRHFEKPYIELLIDWQYKPSIEQLISDYLRHNPTRNRSLDMLPLFCFLDEHKVRDAIDDARVKPRPTFHYRLPNCDLDNPSWNINLPWNLWLEVETLSQQQEKLQLMCEEYSQELSRLTHAVESRWSQRAAALMQQQ